MVKAHKRNSFPGPSDKFQFRASGPEGIERIVAVATSEKNAIVRDNEFGDYSNGFKSYQKGFKDLVVEAATRTEALPETVKWGTAEVKLVLGNVPNGGRITSRNVYMLSIGATTLGLSTATMTLEVLRNSWRTSLRFHQKTYDCSPIQKGQRLDLWEGCVGSRKKRSLRTLFLSISAATGPSFAMKPPAHHPDGISAALICYNTKQRLRRDDPDLKSILLVDNDFAGLMKKIPARRKLIVVDSCHSGSITKEISGGLVPKYIPLLSPEEIRQIRAERQKELHVVDTGSGSSPFGDMTEKESLLAACAKPESSYEDNTKRGGLFTYWLNTNIKNRAPDLQSAFEKTRQKVVDETASRTNRQTPQLSDEYALARAIKFSVKGEAYDEN